MIFKGIPNQYVRFQTKNLRNGRKTGIRFDANGHYETENPRLIKALSRKFEVQEEAKELTEEQIRQLAKEKKIKSWHVKSIDTLREELEHGDNK